MEFIHTPERSLVKDVFLRLEAFCESNRLDKVRKHVEHSSILSSAPILPFRAASTFRRYRLPPKPIPQPPFQLFPIPFLRLNPLRYNLLTFVTKASSLSIAITTPAPSGWPFETSRARQDPISCRKSRQGLTS